jgi:DNA processing protein
VAHFQGENYPERLKHCIDGPLLLFTSGQINLKNRRIISMWVLAKSHLTAQSFAGKINLAPLDPVSGFAYGVDIVSAPDGDGP